MIPRFRAVRVPAADGRVRLVRERLWGCIPARERAEELPGYVAGVITTDTPGGGRHEVRTLSGATYLLDLEEGTVSRTQEAGEENGSDREMSLIRIIECEIGKPLRLVVQLPFAGVVQSKWTGTPVVSIEDVTDRHEYP